MLTAFRVEVLRGTALRLGLLADAREEEELLVLDIRPAEPLLPDDLVACAGGSAKSGA